MDGAMVLGWIAAARSELLLFAAVGFLIGGLDDLLIDCTYVLRRVWRNAVIYSRHRRITSATLPPSNQPGALAVFIPAWNERDVIGSMIGRCLREWQGQDVTLFVGVYPNDPETALAVGKASLGHRNVVMVMTSRPGPTTKADCLNAIWAAMGRTEAQIGRRFKAIVMHDAEDVVHKDAIHVLSAMIDRFDFVQLPVLPLVSAQSRWVAGHYCDEFAEAHGKLMIVREFFGAALPAAGVGCAFRRDVMDAIAASRDGAPFDESSLTEDYELGLRLREFGGRGAMVRMRDASGALVATREYFPDTLTAAVRQKARWMAGIALTGWDRLGWRGGIQERWMRLHDRRAPMAALVLLAGYGALVLTALLWLIALTTPLPPVPLGPTLEMLLIINGGLLVWRLAMRTLFVSHAYGWREGLRSIPRHFVANIIAMMAARVALGHYWRQLRGQKTHWDKTAHRFPTDAEAAAT